MRQQFRIQREHAKLYLSSASSLFSLYDLQNLTGQYTKESRSLFSESMCFHKFRINLFFVIHAESLVAEK